MGPKPDHRLMEHNGSVKILIGLLLALLFLTAFGLWKAGDILTRPTLRSVIVVPASARKVFIRTPDDVHIVGTYWPGPTPQSPAVLLLHGNGRSRESWNATATWLNEHGYAVLAIDFRGHGESSPTPKSFGLFEALDAHAAINWLKATCPHSRIGVVGYSLGGAASLLGEQPLSADAFVLIGVYSDIRHAIFNRVALVMGAWPAMIVEPLLSAQSILRFGVWPSALSPLEVTPRLRAPVMYIGSRADHLTVLPEVQAMYDATSAPKEIHILPDLTHDDLGKIFPTPLGDLLLRFLDHQLQTPSQ